MPISDWSLFGDRLLDLLRYHPQQPLLFNSGPFLLFFTIFLGLYPLVLRRTGLRTAYVLAFSLFFYYKSSGWYVLSLAATATLDYLLALQIFRYRRRKPHLALALALASIVTSVGVLGYFKYTNFFYESFARLAGGRFDALDIFLPIGISFYTFQTLSYVVDVYRGTITPCRRWMDYVFFLSFFPQLVAGPIVRARDFLPQIRKKLTISHEHTGVGLYLILKGLVKKAVLADYIAQYNDLVYGTPEAYSGFEHLMAMYGYTLQIYCDFSGYSDMAIGLALLLGFTLTENFDAPYTAASITEFWRRWHISLSSWLRDYIYIPLGGNRKGLIRQYVNLFLTMLIGGLWHGAGWKFVVWGGMHGIGLATHKLFAEYAGPAYRNHNFARAGVNFIGGVLTFHFVAFLWILFRAPSYQTAMFSIERILTTIDWRHVPAFMEARGLFCAFLTAGFALHFTPRLIRQRLPRVFVAMPLPVKALAFALSVQAVIQLSSEAVQPFIYFQF